jgi:cell division transport system ATP-binding protein
MIDEGYKKSIIQLFHVYKRYEEKLALSDITIDVGKNEFLFISGPSGAGKTTLLKLFYLGERASHGNIIVDGVNLSRITGKHIPQLRRKFGIIFQDYKLIPTKTVYENISLVLQAVGKHRKQIRQRVVNVLRIVGMEDRFDAYPPALSGGEQQRVAVARAVCTDPKIILADEPTGNLDSRSAAIIINLLIQFHTRGATVVVATHNMDMIEKKGGRVLNLKEGRLENITFLDSPRYMRK